MTDIRNPTVTRVYFLYCPMCDDKTYSMWFAFSGDEDDHGYICCSMCVTTLVKMSGIRRRDQWSKVILKEYRRYPEHAWLASLLRTNTLLREVSTAAQSSEDDEQSDARAGTDTDV